MTEFNNDDRQYISLLQGNIDRMASNSANAKTWLVSLATAIAALHFSMNANSVIWVAVVLVVLFFFLDSYYLSIERKFLVLRLEFVKRCKEGSDAGRAELLYNFNVAEVKDKRTSLWYAMGAVSTFPFYLVMFLITLAISLWPIIVG